MHAIIWWTLWGLGVALGVVGLMEAIRVHYYLVIGIPLLTGATAAAILRLRHEYRHAVEHFKWMGTSGIVLLCAMSLVYLKAEARGPFATGTTHKAFLGATFGMSVPELERVLGRQLSERGGDGGLEAQAQAWVLEALPLAKHHQDESYGIELRLHQTPCRAAFHFIEGKLADVRVGFQPTEGEDTAILLRHLRDDFREEYRAVTPTGRSDMAPEVYEKEEVRATLTTERQKVRRADVSILIQYLPLVPASPNPVVVESNAF